MPFWTSIFNKKFHYLVCKSASFGTLCVSAFMPVGQLTRKYFSQLDVIPSFRTLFNFKGDTETTQAPVDDRWEPAQLLPAASESSRSKEISWSGWVYNAVRWSQTSLKCAVQRYRFSFLTPAPSESGACLGSTSSLSFPIKKGILIFDGPFWLMLAEGCRIPCRKVSTQILCMWSKEALLILSKLPEINCLVRVRWSSER